MKLLLVDPEPRVPEGIARILFELEPTWEVLSARTMREAMFMLAPGGCDVVVTELSGRELDGTALLECVADRYPDAARFVLSGQPAEEAPVKLLTLAHQLLPKPYAAETLHHVVGRLQILRGALPERKLRTLASQASALPSPRGVLRKAQLAQDPVALGRWVRTDPALTAKVMQLATSGFICGSSKLADVDGALQQLGARWVGRIVQSLSVPESDTRPAPLATASRAWRRSHEVAEVAAQLARLPEDAAAAYVAGLLCDVGQLLLEQAAPERLYLARAEAAQHGLPSHVVERQTWGTTHAELGAYLLGLWGLPHQIVEAVAHHHAPERAPSDSASLTQLVWVAASVVAGEVPSAHARAQAGVDDLYRRAQEVYGTLAPAPDSTLH